MDASVHQLDDAKARALHLLTCPLCTKQYEDPRVLPCQHTFCCRCLSSHVDRVQSSRITTSSTRLGAFPCPLCHADVGLPTAGASAFPVDQRIRNIRDLVVEEMAKDLASQFKGRLHTDGMCNGGSGVGVPDDDVHSRRGGVPNATRLSKISEGPGADDNDSAYGTWPSSARTQGFSDESSQRSDFACRTPDADDTVFSRQRPGYSSAGAGSRTRSRTQTPVKRVNSYDDSRFEVPTSHDSAQTTGGTSSFDTGFSRDRPTYFSARVPRTRRSRMADIATQSMYDDIGRSEGNATTSSNSFGSGYGSSQASEPVRMNYRQYSSHVDVSSKSSSPFDNLNRDDDISEPYTPIIGRHRFGYHSLREMRRRPVFDPSQLYDDPANFVDEELSSTGGSSRFRNNDSRFTGNRHTGTSSQTHDASEFSESVRDAVFSNQNRTQSRTQFSACHNTHEQKLSENNRDSSARDRLRTSDKDQTAGRNVTGARKTARQTPDSHNTSNLTKTTVDEGKISECRTSANDHNQPQMQVNHRSEEVGHRTNDSVSTVTSGASDIVQSVSETRNDVASQLHVHCSVDVDKTDDIVNSKQTKPTADSIRDRRASKADDGCPSSPELFSPTKNIDSVDQTEFVMNKERSTSDERIYSPTHSPNESCFSRLTEYRLSWNFRHAKSSAADSTSKDAESPSPCEASASSNTTSKSRVRKRPQAFVGQPLDATAGSAVEESAASPRSVNDELNCESVSYNTEHPSDQQLKLHSPCVSDSTVDDVCNNGMSFDAHVQGNSSQTAADVKHSQTCQSNVQSPADDVFISQQVTRQLNDEDSAVYSIASSDASVKSATEPCVPTPTTDDDEDPDDVLVQCDELKSTTQGDQTGDNDDCGLTLSESRCSDDVNVECYKHDDAELMSKVHESGFVLNGDARDDDSGDRSLPDELRHQPHADDDTVNEDDVRTNNETATDKDGHSESGFRTSDRSVHADDVTDSHTEDGFMLATGLASLSDGSLVVADYGAGCVCLCDGDGRADHRVTGVKPFSVATSTSTMISDDDELIYVGDRRRKTLVALDHHGADVAQWPDHQFDWICGIACLSDGHLAVLDRSRTRQLGIYPTSGNDDRPLTELGGQGTSLGDLCMAEFIAADSLGRVLVADSGNHCVKAFDRRVKPPSVVAVYGTTRGSGDAQLEWPKGVAVDSADNVLVADCRNGRVVSFSVDGRSLGSVVPVVRGPYAVCTLPTSVTRRRRLAVTTYLISGLSDFHLYDYDTDAIFV